MKSYSELETVRDQSIPAKIERMFSNCFEHNHLVVIIRYIRQAYKRRRISKVQYSLYMSYAKMRKCGLDYTDAYNTKSRG